MKSIHLYIPDRSTAHVMPPHIHRDYAYRATDRPAEHGPCASTVLDRLFWVAGGLALVAFWSFALLAVLDRVQS